MIKTSLVIPLFNEEKNILNLIQMIENQTIKPNEIIFINAGSTDNTKEIIQNRIKIADLKDVKVVIKNTSKLYPGGSRNLGVKISTNDHIFFMDAGIEVNKKWIESTLKIYNENKCEIVWGACKFTYKDTFSEALCSVTFGKNKVYKTIPGSLVKKEIFERIVKFDSSLRSAEDLLWMKKIKENNLKNLKNNLIFNTYNSYPSNIFDLTKKWFINAYYSLRSKLYFYHSLTYIIFFLLLFFCFFNSQFFIELLFLYLVLRIILLPIIKNKKIFWFSNIYVFIYSLFIPIFLDISKFFGFIAGYFLYVRK